MVVTILLGNIEYASTKLEHTVCERMTVRTMTDPISTVVLATVGLAQARPNYYTSSSQYLIIKSTNVHGEGGGLRL